jgi:mannose-6-phosphate isomerase
MLSVEGDVLDPTQRIWAQAEYLRALTLRQDSAERLQHQLLALQQHFLHAKGWNECLDAHGVLSRRDMPSTTPYHLATCYLGLAEYFG